MERQGDEARLADLGALQDLSAGRLSAISCSIHSSPALIPKMCWEVYKSLLNSNLPFGEDWMDPTDRKWAVS